MARKVEQVVIEAEGREQGKTFILTEMPAIVAERWATQAKCGAAPASNSAAALSLLNASPAL